MISASDMMSGRGKLVNPQLKNKGTLKEKGTKDNKDKKQSGNNSSKKRHMPYPKVMGYPLARSQSEKTGDSLLIKCFSYEPPRTGITGDKVEFIATKDGKDAYNRDIKKGMNKTNKSNEVVTGYAPGSITMVNEGASDRTKKTKHHYYIELPIPQDVNDSNTVTWGDDNMNIFQLAGVAAAANFIKDPAGGFEAAREVLTRGIFGDDNEGGSFSGIDAKTQNAIRAAIGGKAINALGGQISTNSVLGRAQGVILNSNLELLFDSVNLRSFPFSINFSPRNPDESMMVKHIIRALKHSMAAKKEAEQGQGGIFLRAPDVFSLRYLHNGVDHPFLNSFKDCALTGMAVNYTNAGTYASYGEGTPVSIKMDLTFKELNPIYHEDYEEFSMGDGLGVGY